MPYDTIIDTWYFPFHDIDERYIIIWWHNIDIRSSQWAFSFHCFLFFSSPLKILPFAFLSLHYLNIDIWYFLLFRVIFSLYYIFSTTIYSHSPSADTLQYIFFAIILPLYISSTILQYTFVMMILYLYTLERGRYFDIPYEYEKKEFSYHMPFHIRLFLIVILSPYDIIFFSHHFLFLYRHTLPSFAIRQRETLITLVFTAIRLSSLREYYYMIHIIHYATYSHWSFRHRHYHFLFLYAMLSSVVIEYSSFFVASFILYYDDAYLHYIHTPLPHMEYIFFETLDEPAFSLSFLHYFGAHWHTLPL